MRTKTPVHPEHLFTVSRIAGTTYRITEAAKLGSLEGPPDTWWFGRDRSGDSTFQVLPDAEEGRLSTRAITYRFWKDELATQGTCLNYRGSDGSVAQVYI